MKFSITFRVHAVFETEVEADSIEEATEKARQRFSEADFGEAANIDGEICCMEDDYGNIIWSK